MCVTHSNDKNAYFFINVYIRKNKYVRVFWLFCVKSRLEASLYLV